MSKGPSIYAELAKMLALFPAPEATRESTKLRMEGYVDVIGGFPAWVVQIACAKVCRGLVPDLNRSFAPTPAELAEIVRAVLVDQGQKAAADGAIRFDGEIPTTWIDERDPRWRTLCDVAKRADPKNKHYPMASKYAPGRGSFFRTEFVDAVPQLRAVK